MKLHACFYLLAAVIALIYGCKKDEPDESNVSYEDIKPVKDYVYFQPGTYWIYEDNYGNVDSMYVYSAGEGIDTVRKSNGDIEGIYRFFQSKIHSVYDDYNYYIGYNSGWTSFHPTQHKVFMTKTKPGDYVGQIFLTLYPFKIGDWRYWNDSKTTTIDYFQNYGIDNNSFVSVGKVNVFNDITNNYRQTTNYYIAKNVGIIQEELIDSSNVWKLVRYNIVQ